MLRGILRYDVSVVGVPTLMFQYNMYECRVQKDTADKIGHCRATRKVPFRQNT